MISPNVETFIGCDSSYRAADIVLYGAPFDSTTSYRPYQNARSEEHTSELQSH